MDSLSVVIITLNEEENIGGCLQSVAWADEIVVVDSGSTDRTVDICRKYTDKVFVEGWKGYGRQKNLAIERVKGGWILNVDADERVTPGLREEIEDVLRGKRSGYDGFYIPRKNFFMGRWIKRCGWYPDYTLRLFKKGKGCFNERKVHEAVRVEGDTGYLKHPLEHYTYKGVSDYLRRMERYSSLAAEEMLKEGKKTGLFDLLIRPGLTFLKMYLLKLGFLEGYRGLILSGLYASYTFSKYARLWEMGRGGGE